ncbi:hypothetical protein MYCTH_2311899 [Thermothelomyces thermophilus ATCC 42464]|uniref:BHLH domain-containing protein n=1 Tax=Thermothelomyces thermophilus (strain ATCC 42464 / BCRC 31852 / DSM 1799) TaxID=573729 RepID=G2QPS7_THET4|nr:uncharacterized protein MYCTH_2311899 [Thermothelomyces thermophilus ATCC 42464]AEO61590.1 hypothetical protein MYCTH_2311899 [Thermothelomyces thermophilus ATCC 42464]
MNQAASQQSYQQPYQEADREDSPGVPGAELLDDYEQRYLNSFFGSVASASNGTPLAAQALGGLCTQDWMKPADVVGHVVRFGDPDNALLSEAFGMFDFSPSTDLGIAASTTPGFPDNYQSQNGSAFQQFQQSQQSEQTQSYYDSLHTPDAVAAAATLVGRGSMPFGLYPEVSHSLTTASQTMVSSQPDPFTLGNGRYGTQAQMSMARRTSNAPRTLSVDVQYGSDPNFTDTSFVPPSAKETTEAITAEQLAHLRCLEPSHSAAPTRAASPTSWGAQYSSNEASRNSVVVPVRRTVSHNPPPPDEPPTRRRRTSKMGEAPVDAEQAMPTPVSPTAPPLTQRKRPSAASPPPAPPSGTAPPQNGDKPSAASASESNGTPSDPTQTKRQRKSGTGKSGAGRKKSPRTTLTPEQRRQNHVGSERRRRDFIGRGYDHLMAIVPGLMNGAAPSKSVSLNLVADWIEELHRGNQTLENMMAFTFGQASGSTAPSASAAAA